MDRSSKALARAISRHPKVMATPFIPARPTSPPPAIRTSKTERLTEISRWDQFLMRVAPQWGLRRLQARAQARALVGMMARHFEAADAGGRRTEGWNRSPTDANSAQSPALILLREYSRDLKRNNGWARRAIEVIASDTIGWGIIPTALDANADKAKAATAIWRQWAESTECDYAQRMPFTGLQRLLMEAIVESGEVLIRRHRGGTEGMKIPLRVQVLESDYLDIHRDGLWGEEDGPIIQGVEFNHDGKRVAYWLYDQHPGAFRLYRHHWISRRVPAADVIHFYNVDRPGATRGIAWLCAAIAKLQDLNDYDDAALMRAKIASCFAAFVTDLEGTAAPVGKLDDDTADGGGTPETIEPGMVSYLPPGKSITFGSPPQDQQQQQVTTMGLRKIAGAIGAVTYEEISLDFSQVNFSSARMARQTKWNLIHGYRWNMLIPQFRRLWDWVFELAVIQGMIDEIPRSKWTPPPLPMIDPEKEGLATSRLIRNGLVTQDEAVREQGHDPEEHFAEIAASNTRLDRLGIKLDSDPRNTTSSGGPVGGGNGGREAAT